MEVEDRAKLMGWVPKEDFKGDTERWTEAEVWVERADNIMPIMKSQMGKYEKTIESQSEELKSTKADIKELRETMTKMASIHKNVSEREYNKALETIRAEQTKAINDGDGEAFAKLEKDKDDLISNKPEVVDVEPKPEGNQTNPEYQAWLVDNPWYEDNPKLKKYADSVVFGKAQMTGKKGNELLALVKDEVKEMFPEEFENPNRAAAAAVSGGTTQGGVKENKKKGYSDMPQDAKDACNSFVEDGLMTKEEYVAMYHEGE